VPQGNPRCAACKLEVKQMDAFAAAKKAAMAKGKRGVEETSRQKPRELPFFLRPGIIALVVFVVLVGAGAYKLFGPKPPRYLKFPGSAQEAATELMQHISAGTDPEYLKAYDLIVDSARDPKSSDEKGDYQQVFHVMNLYLSGEFGNDWFKQATFAPDPADPKTIVAKISIETLRIHTEQATPADKVGAQGQHFGVVGVDDFGPGQAASLRQMAAIEGIIKGVGGNAALDNLKTVIGANEGNRHLPRMMLKIDLLETNRNPRTATRKSIIQMYPVRKDPVVRARLQQITQDERYSPDAREKAQKLLTGRFDTDDEDLVDANVQWEP